MPILTTIDGVPLYSTVEEALSYGELNNLIGYHTHTYLGQIGYMAGGSHGAAAASSAGFEEISDNGTTSTNIPSSSSGGY